MEDKKKSRMYSFQICFKIPAYNKALKESVIVVFHFLRDFELDIFCADI